jgi:hypothetical protein
MSRLATFRKQPDGTWVLRRHHRGDVSSLESQVDLARPNNCSLTAFCSSITVILISLTEQCFLSLHRRP